MQKAETGSVVPWVSVVSWVSVHGFRIAEQLLNGSRLKSIQRPEFSIQRVTIIAIDQSRVITNDNNCGRASTQSMVDLGLNTISSSRWRLSQNRISKSFVQNECRHTLAMSFGCSIYYSIR
jgi:hypothetical protein